MTNEQYTELQHFFCGYFNQDWTLDYENEECAIKAYVFETSRDYIESTLQEIQKLKKGHYDEKCLSDIFRQLGSAYYYQANNMTGEEWLDYVSDAIKKYLAEKQQLEENNQSHRL